MLPNAAGLAEMDPTRKYLSPRAALEPPNEAVPSERWRWSIKEMGPRKQNSVMASSCFLDDEYMETDCNIAFQTFLMPNKQQT